MTSLYVLQRNKHLIRAHFDAIWSGDDAAIRSQLADDFVDHTGTAKGRGPQAVIEWSRTMRGVFPDMQVKIERAVAEDDYVVTYATWRGTQKAPFQGIAPTNKTISFTGMVLWRIVDGKITDRWAVLDLAGIVRQLQS